MTAAELHVEHVDGVRTVFRRTSGEGAPVLFVHGNPGSSEDWLPFIERLERPAIALDLPGWGQSERRDPRRFDYSMQGLGRFVERFCDSIAIGEHALCVHDWGAIGLIAAQRRPERVNRLVVINAVPLLPGYRWHWIARYFWRVPFVGELANATTTRSSLGLLSRQASATPGPLPSEFLDLTWRNWPRGSWPAMLRLYRSADPARLAAAGEGLDRLTVPALVVWGVDDPYLPRRFGAAYADRLPRARLVELDRAGHWPWLDRPDSIEPIVDFLDAGG